MATIIPEELQRKFNSAKQIAVLTGTAFSTTAGIPDLRSGKGVPIADEEALMALTDKGFEASPEAFYRAAAPICRKFFEARPSFGHNILANWERCGKEVFIVTETMDGLHQLAGSTKVYEFYGSVFGYSLKCRKCNENYPCFDFQEELLAGLVPHCPKCGEVLKPSDELFHEIDTMPSNEAIAEARIHSLGALTEVAFGHRGEIDSDDLARFLQTPEGSRLNNRKIDAIKYLRAMGGYLWVRPDMFLLIGMNAANRKGLLKRLFHGNQFFGADNNVVVIEAQPGPCELPWIPELCRPNHVPYFFFGDFAEILNGFRFIPDSTTVP